MGRAHAPPPLDARCSAYTWDSVPFAEICPAGYIDWEDTPPHMPRLWEPSHILVNVRQEAPGVLSQPAPSRTIPVREGKDGNMSASLGAGASVR